MTTKSGPLTFPLVPPTKEAARAVEKLRGGHASSDLWLPEGLWPELDEARAELLRVRGQMADELDLLAMLGAAYAKEDKEYAEALQQAQRNGVAKPVEDKRTPPEEREKERAAVEERMWAGAIVLAEVADSVVELAREHESEWLADLRQRLEPARGKRRELENLLAEARAEEWHKYELAMWLKKLVEDGPFGRQPAPTTSEPPAQFDQQLLATAFERPWHQRRDAEKLPRSWTAPNYGAAGQRDEEELPPDPESDDPRDLPPYPAVDDGVIDETGTVYPLDPSVSGATSS